jgi:hypothetical protein
MQEKRKLKRRHLIYYLRVFDRNTDDLIGHLVDITPEGAMLISDRPIETNTVFQFRMALPREIIRREHLYFDAESLWCQKDVNPSFYNTGFRFVKVSRDHLVIIDQLLDDFGFRD